MEFVYQAGSQHVIVKLSEDLSSELSGTFASYMEGVSSEDANVIVEVSGLKHVSEATRTVLMEWRKEILDSDKSFVICGQPAEDFEWPEDVEYTPTLSEAQDIVFMDEVECSL